MLIASPPASSQAKSPPTAPPDAALIRDLVAANRILANHDILIYIDADARVQLQAISLGGTVTHLHPDEARLVQEDGENAGYRRSGEMWRRKALGE